LSPAELAALAGRCESFSALRLNRPSSPRSTARMRRNNRQRRVDRARDTEHPPLAVVMAEKVAALRAWAGTRTVSPTDTANASAPACAAYGGQGEQIKQIADGRHVVRHVGSCGLYRIRANCRGCDR